MVDGDIRYEHLNETICDGFVKKIGINVKRSQSYWSLYDVIHEAVKQKCSGRVISLKIY
mgnify:CR=1 FL=1